MSKAIVLLSGGLDSTTLLYWAAQNFDKVHALSFLYGQRHRRELNAAAHVASLVGVPHDVTNISGTFDDVESLLTQDSDTPINGTDEKGLPLSFVPGRNLFFLTIAGTLARIHEADSIIIGACGTDKNPDASATFLTLAESTLSVGLALPTLRVLAPLMRLGKAEVVRLARRLPGCWEALRFTVTCYQGTAPGCGVCAACEARAAGFAEAGLADPAVPAP